MPFHNQTGILADIPDQIQERDNCLFWSEILFARLRIARQNKVVHAEWCDVA